VLRGSVFTSDLGWSRVVTCPRVPVSIVTGGFHGASIVTILFWSFRPSSYPCHPEWRIALWLLFTNIQARMALSTFWPPFANIHARVWRAFWLLFTSVRTRVRRAFWLLFTSVRTRVRRAFWLLFTSVRTRVRRAFWLLFTRIHTRIRACALSFPFSTSRTFPTFSALLFHAAYEWAA